MPEIFDLSKIKRLVEEKRPPAILIVDTNVLMNEPDFSKWETSIGKPIYVLADTTMVELEYIKTKPEPREKAIKAIKSMNNLFQQGKITDGIVIEDVGSFISIPTPKADQLNPELEQLDDILKAFKRSDTKFLLLTRECNQLIPNIPTLFLTGEYNLFNIMEANGVPSYMFESFPMSGIEEVIKKSLIKPIDWDTVLADMQVTTTQNSIVVEATLTTYKSAPKWLGTESLIIAEGYGTMYDGKKNRSFLWTIPFYARTFASSTKPLEETTSDLPPIHLDFLGEDDFGQDLFDAIADRLLNCTNPSFEEGTPALQNPQSIMEMLLFSEYSREGRPQDELERIKQAIEETEGEFVEDGWIELMVDRDSDKLFAVFLRFMQALRSCWTIGHTYTFRIMAN